MDNFESAPGFAPILNSKWDERFNFYSLGALTLFSLFWRSLRMFEGYVGVEIKIWKMMGSFGEK